MLQTLRLRSLVALLLMMWSAAGLAVFGKTAEPKATQTSVGAPTILGSAKTLLPNGQLLISGGQDSHGEILTTLSTMNPVTGTTTVLQATLRFPRTFHTATVLPNGTVLLLGGIGTGGNVVTSSEIFDPVSETVGIPALAAPIPRAYHTATLLTDGRVLIAGGVLANAAAATAMELWDPRGLNTVMLTSPLMDRRDQTAVLQSDGRVLFTGGVDENWNPVTQAQIFNPQSLTLTAISVTQLPPLATGLTQISVSSPQDGDQNVPLNSLIAVCFSRPAQMASITSATMTLAGPEGTVAGTTVAAEDGMLAFITPTNGLSPGTTYVVTVSGAVDDQNQSVAYAQFSFFTAGNAVTASGNEEWLPSSPTDWVTHRAPSEYQSLPNLQGPNGTTALAGQVLKLNGDPLPNVTLELGNRHTVSDSTGRFLLTSIPSGHQVLTIEGATANTASNKYGRYEFGDEIKAGVTNKLDFTIWMAVLDMAHAVKIPSPTLKETIITTPTMPGLELHLPAGTVITDAYGKRVTQITITPIPLDRPPFPLPFVIVPTYFTIQPGGAYISVSGNGPKGASLFYPNTEQAKPGVPYAFWNYNPDQIGWYVYGEGKVNQQGTQVVPNPGVVIYDFSGAMVGSGNAGPPTGDPAGDNSTDGEPVGLSTGLFTYRKTDLALPDVIPITLTRTYRPNDSWSRPFGIGASHPYEMFLGGNGLDYGSTDYIDLILPNGSRVHFTGVGIGPGYTTYLNSSAGTPWYGAVISQPGPTILRTKDGTQYSFLESPGLINPGCQALIGIRDRNGNQVTITRNNDANCTIAQITSPSGRYIQFQYDSLYRINVATDNMGRQVFYNYNISGTLASVTDVQGGLWQYGYNTLNQMTTIEDPRQITYLTNYYNSNGMVQYQYLADGVSYYQFNWIPTSNTTNDTFSINGGSDNVAPYNVMPFRECGNCSEGFSPLVSQVDVIDPLGYTRQVVFNQNGYTSSDTRALGMPEQETYTYTYYPDDLINTVTDQLGRVTNYTFDANGDTTSITQLSGTANAVSIYMAYDPVFANLLTLTDPLGNTTNWQYDTNGNVTSVADPLQHQTTFTHNTMGLVTSVTDPMQDATRFGYDLGDLTSITDPMLNTTTMFHDAGGRIVFETDPLGNTTKYFYNNFDQVTQVTDPLEGITTYTYDPNGNLHAVQDARQQGTNNQTVYTYDNFDHLQTRTDPLQRQEYYTFDQIGDLIGFTDRRGVVSAYQYDGIHRRVFAGFGLQSSSYQSTINYYYDGGNRLTNVVDSALGTISPLFDSLNRLTLETTPQGSVSYQYDNDGRRTIASVAGQPSTCYSYDNASRLTGIGQGTCPTSANVVGFTYDNANRRQTVTFPNGMELTYGYDNDSRVNGMAYTLAAMSLGSLTYNYDADGRTIQKGGSLAAVSLPNPVASATYDAANELTNWNGITIGYDSNGNVLNDGVAAYSWDARNQLSSRGAASFQYDAYGRRVVNSAGTQFLYEGGDSVQELSGTTPTANRILGSVDEFFNRTDQTGSYSPMVDLVGSVVALTNSAGGISTQYGYDSFGNTSSSGAGSTNVFQYTGRENDNNGLYYYRARYYSPSFGRFVSEDPIGFLGGINKYAYVGDSPLDFRDPYGTSTCWIHYDETYDAALFVTGNSTYARLLAAAVCLEDVGTQGTSFRDTRRHAMAGRKDNGDEQTCGQAYLSTAKFVNTTDDLAAAIHAIQDSYASGHQYQFWPGGLPSWQHLSGDSYYLPYAEGATVAFLQDMMSGNLQDARTYLHPLPDRCVSWE